MIILLILIALSIIDWLTIPPLGTSAYQRRTCIVFYSAAVLTGLVLGVASFLFVVYVGVAL